MRILLYRLRYLVFIAVLSACSGKYLVYEKADQLRSNEEFEQKVKIVETPPPVDAVNALATPPKTPESLGPKSGKTDKKTERKKGKKSSKKEQPKDQQKDLQKETPIEAALSAPVLREPELEDNRGFQGRRPIVDPFRVGEEVVHKVFYETHIFNFSAGTLSLKIDPMVEVNGRKSYQFVTSVKSSPWFSSYYSVDDKAVALVDYDLLIPRVFSLHIKESAQLREVRSFFDFDSGKANYWEKKVTEKSGVEEKKLQWEILPFSQNVYSAMYYLRIFQWEVGQEYSFRVSDEAENLVFKAKVLARETLKTELGPKVAIKIKPEFTVKGAFKPVGDIYIWISDDDRKMVLKIECKIKIGSLVSEVAKITP